MSVFFRKSVLVLIIFVMAAFVAPAMPAFAVPALQLDIVGGTYDYVTETIVTNKADGPFIISALLTEKNNGEKITLDPLLTYYMSVALAPKTKTPGDYGSFDIDGVTKDVTGDMTYGSPPFEAALSALNLPPHGIFDTYYLEESFTFEGAPIIQTYNTQDRAKDGFITPIPNMESYIYSWVVDAAALAGDFNLHFDLYTATFNADGSVDKFYKAPFSHDAQTTVPEPSTLLLLGAGLLGLAGFRRKFKV